MFVRQYANGYSQKKKKRIVAAVWAASSTGRPTLRQKDCATEIQLRRGRLHLKRGLRRAHHHLHDSLRWYLLLSLPVRLFFQFVFKVQYISTRHKKTEKDGVDLDSGCCYMPYDFGLHQTVNIRVASHLTLMIVTVHWLIIDCTHSAFARSLMGQ